LAGARAAHEAVVKELAGARAAHEAVAADLAEERKAVPNRDHAQAKLQSQLEAERATVAELRQAAARAEELSATLSRESSKGHEAHEEAALLQTSLADAQRALAAAQAELETERAAMVEVRQFAEYSDQQLASARSNEAQTVADHQKLSAQLDALSKERSALIDELATARSAIAQPREVQPEPAAAASLASPHVEPHTPKGKAKAHAPASAKKQQIEPEEGWQSVRLAVRYMFSTDLSVQVNGNPARIFDISISGCQLLSPTALKPNQMVKIVLPDVPPVTCSGKVIWTRLEPMAVGQPLGYRAGVRFTKADEIAIETFAARYANPA
jgi:PilZ domain